MLEREIFMLISEEKDIFESVTHVYPTFTQGNLFVKMCLTHRTGIYILHLRFTVLRFLTRIAFSTCFSAGIM